METPPDSQKKTPSPFLILYVVASVQFLTPFMMSATGVALPAIGREFNAGAVHLGLIEMVYILAVTLLLLPSGRFADIHGRKKIFITGASIMTVATLFLAMSMNIRFFIVLRFFQGVGAAMITATSMAIITSVIPRHKLGQAMGIIIACVYMGLSAGPTLAGIMITNFGWRWIFYAAVPLELAALLLTVVKLKGEWAGARGQKFDWAGSLIYMTALFALITGAAGLEKVHGALWLAGAGGVLLVVFLFFEARIPSPLLDMHLLATNRVFTFSNIATWINYAACFGFLFFFSIYLQSVKGLPAQTAGLILVIQPVIQAISSPIAGRLADRYPPAYIATIGMVICTADLAVAAAITADTPMVMIFLILGAVGLGFGIFSSPNTTAVMSSVGQEHYGIAASLLATMRGAGMLASMTLITAILSLFMGDHAVTVDTIPAFITSMRTAFVCFSFLCAVGVGFSFVRFQAREKTQPKTMK
jgi:MFS family permease